MKRITRIALSVLSLLSASACDRNLDGSAPSISIDGDDRIELGVEASSITVKIVTNCESWDYEFTETPDWIGKGRKRQSSASFFVYANDSYDERSAQLVFFAPDSPEKRASATFTIVQAGLERGPELNLSPERVDFPSEGGSDEVEVSTNCGDWDIENFASDWLSVKKEQDKLVLTAAKNSEDLDRSQEIKVSALSKDGLPVKTLIVTQEHADIDYDPEDLSAGGTSNCYMITHKGEYFFNATVKGNGAATEDLAAPSALAPASAQLVWQSVKGMISEVSLVGERVRFTATRTNGNALIAVRDAAGEIIWSWHIWFPSSLPQTYAMDGGFSMMSMNLGAMDSEPGAASHGLLYQWGRKDPFPASPIASGGNVNTKNAPVYDIDGKEVAILASQMYASTQNTLAYSISHPTTCLSNGATGSKDWLKSESNPAFWGNPKGNVHNEEGEYPNMGAKSYYDPCPKGWRVPPTAVYRHVTGSGQYAWVAVQNGEILYDENGNMAVSYFFGPDTFDVYDVNGDGKFTMDDYVNGWYFNLSDGVHSYFPAAARYDGQYAMLMGSVVGQWGNYWTNAPSYNSKTSSYEPMAISMGFNICDYEKKTQITMSPSGNAARADAYSIRCIKE